MRELAGSRVRWGNRRLTLLLRRERWKVNEKRIYRLYTEEGLTVDAAEAQEARTESTESAAAGRARQSALGDGFRRRSASRRAAVSSVGRWSICSAASVWRVCAVRSDRSRGGK